VVRSLYEAITGVAQNHILWKNEKICAFKFSWFAHKRHNHGFL